MNAYLRWWLMFCLMAIGAAVLYKFGMFEALNNADATKISFIIIAAFTMVTGYIGLLTKRRAFNEEITDQQFNICWFAADEASTLGLIGTVIGFMIMLSLAFVGIDVSDVTNVQGAINLLAIGMSSALSTTLCGMLAGLLLRLQMVNLEYGYDQKKE